MRGKYAKQYHEGVKLIMLEADVQKYFRCKISQRIAESLIKNYSATSKSRLTNAPAMSLDAAKRDGDGSRQGCKSWRVKVPLPSVAQNGRLAYPLLGEVTDRDMRGRKSHGRPVY